MRTSSYNTLALALLHLWTLLFVFVDAADENDSTTATTIFDTTVDIRWSTGLMAVLAMIGGAILCFAGYKLVRPAMFACAFIFGGLVVATVIESVFSSKSWVVTASWIGFFVGGIIVACLVLAVYDLGIFLAGATGGVLLAFTINTSFGHKIYPSNPDTVLLILAIALGIIGGIVAVKLERPVLIVATSFVGAQALVWGVGYFAGDYPNGADLKRFATQQPDGKWIYEIPAAWWGYLAGIVVLFVLGMLAQFHKTGRGVYHRTRAIPASSSNGTPQVDAYGNAQTPQCRGNPISHV